MERKKMISILIPCYNEVLNIEPMAIAVTEQMKKFPQYDYEIIFRDNASTDGSLDVLRKIAKQDKRIKVIVNCRNYGNITRKNSFEGRISGDVSITIACDFQEPPELIPEFIKWWEAGYEVVGGQKIGSKEGFVKYGCRRLFYQCHLVRCFLQVLFGQSCKIFLDIVACPNWTKLQSGGQSCLD